MSRSHAESLRSPRSVEELRTGQRAALPQPPWAAEDASGHRNDGRQVEITVATLRSALPAACQRQPAYQRPFALPGWHFLLPTSYSVAY